MYCEEYTYSQIIFVIVLVVLLIFALSWEYKDYGRIKARPYLCDIKCPKKRKKELEFHACFNGKNNVQWRGIFIMSFIAALLVTYILTQFYPDRPLNINLFILTFGSILIVFYIGNTYRTYHLYRDMCARVKSDKNIL